MPTLGERVCQFIETFLRLPEGRNVGQPFRLAPHQRRFILAVFNNPNGPTRRGILSMARKGGKSALISAIGLAYVAGPLARENAQVVVGARSREQAGIIFDLASKIIRLSPELIDRTRVVPSSKTIVGLAKNVTLKAISAEASTAFGLSPVCVILDELGQVRGPVDAFVEALLTSQMAYADGLVLAISTQSPTDADLFSVWIDAAERGDDPQVICHRYSAPPDCELDEEAAHAANPGLATGITDIATVLSQLEEARRVPAREASVRNLLLNQRIQLNAPFITPAVWARGNRAINQDLFRSGLPVHLGIDLSLTSDWTCVALAVTDPTDGITHIDTRIFHPLETLDAAERVTRAPLRAWLSQGRLIGVPGSAVDYDFLALEVGRMLSEGVGVASIAYDRWRSDFLQLSFKRIGLQMSMTPFGQGFRDMAPAIDGFLSAILDGKLAHGQNPVLAHAVSGAVTERDAAGNLKLTKAKSHNRIDPIIAAIMATAGARLPRVMEIDIAAMIG